MASSSFNQAPAQQPAQSHFGGGFGQAPAQAPQSGAIGGGFGQAPAPQPQSFAALAAQLADKTMKRTLSQRVTKLFSESILNGLDIEEMSVGDAYVQVGMRIVDIIMSGESLPLGSGATPAHNGFTKPPSAVPSRPAAQIGPLRAASETAQSKPAAPISPPRAEAAAADKKSEGTV